MFPLHDDKPIESTPFVTISVIVICIWVWLWQLTLGEEGFQRAAYAFGLVPAVLTGKAEIKARLRKFKAQRLEALETKDREQLLVARKEPLS